MTARNIPTPELIESRSTPEPNTGCWLWTWAHKRSNGMLYGSVKVGGRSWVASRLSYTIFVGPIPSGLDVLHQCDTPACVNPAHLFLGTDKDNSDDKHRKGRAVVFRGGAHPKALLTDEQVAWLRQGGLAVAADRAAELGVSRAVVVRAISGRSWGHIGGARPVRKLQRVTAETIESIRSEWDGKKGTQVRLSRKYGVSRSHVHRLVNGLARGKVEKIDAIELGTVRP